MASFAFVLIAAVFLAYVAYSSFDNWTYTRFLLPAFPFAIVSSVWTAAMLGRRLGSPLVQAIVALVVIFVVLAWMRESNDRLILQTARGERRYIEAARFAARTTPDDAIVLAMQHSGSVRYYAARTTIRYDWLPESRLDEAILFLQRIGRRPILVLDDWEEPQFKRRFAGQKWGALDWPPRAEVESQPVARVYDPFDRDRYHASQRIPTVRLPLPKN